VKKKSAKARIKYTNGEEKNMSRTKRTKTPVEVLTTKEPPNANFSFSDEKEVISAADVYLKDNLV
jgi:hypothetical protein